MNRALQVDAEYERRARYADDEDVQPCQDADPQMHLKQGAPGEHRLRAIEEGAQAAISLAAELARLQGGCVVVATEQRGKRYGVQRGVFSRNGSWHVEQAFVIFSAASSTWSWFFACAALYAACPASRNCVSPFFHVAV